MPLPEHPVATHDGMIWPIPRAETIHALPIRARLAEDVCRILASGKRDLSVGDFVALGWTESQVIAHSREAIDAARRALTPPPARPPQPDIRPASGHEHRAAMAALGLNRIVRRIQAASAELAAVAADLDAATGEAASRGLATILLVGAVLGVAVVLA